MLKKGRDKRSGENNNHSKLTEKDVIEIRHRLYLGKETQEKIAKEYGVKQTAISRIYLGKSWKDIKVGEDKA